jgi:hypothetical protein
VAENGCVSMIIPALLYLRQRKLLKTLTRRGHAAQDKLHYIDTTSSDKAERKLPEQWSKVIRVLRQNPHWQQSPSTGDDFSELQALVTGWLLEVEA